DESRLGGGSGDVIEEHRAWRKGRYGLLEVVVESVVGELQNFLRSVRPQIAIHAGMDRLAIFIGAGAPGVVPQAAPIALLLVANNVWDLCFLACSQLKCA